MKVKETRNKVVFIGILVRMSPEKGVLIISVNTIFSDVFFLLIPSLFLRVAQLSNVLAA